MNAFFKLGGSMLRAATTGGVLVNGRDLDLTPWLSRDEQIELLEQAHRLNGDLENLPGSVAKLPMVPDFVAVGMIGMMLNPEGVHDGSN